MAHKRSSRQIAIRQLKKNNMFFVPYVKTIDSLNNIYVTTSMARQGLITLREDLKSQSPSLIEIEIPAANQIEIRKEREKSKIVSILKKSIRTDLLANSINSGVSITEYFFTDIIRLILKKHPKKLKIDVGKNSKKESQESKKIDLDVVVDATSIDELYDTIIDQRLQKLFYATPAEYFDYLRNTVNIELEDDLVLDYIEIKATRDLLVHNQGKINQRYIDKAGMKARSKNTKHNIPINSEYFLHAFGVLKRSVRDSYILASEKHLKLKKNQDLFPPGK